VGLSGLEFWFKNKFVWFECSLEINFFGVTWIWKD
jgi:hypothetical protein